MSDSEGGVEEGRRRIIKQERKEGRKRGKRGDSEELQNDRRL